MKNTNNNKPINKISVRNLVEFILRKGDLKSGFISSSRALAGTKGHQKVQKKRKKEFNYETEKQISYLIEQENYNLEISGRIDGIYLDNNPQIIDEIKTTYQTLSEIDEDQNELHWAQAKLYGYIYALDNKLDKIIIQLTYFNLDTESTIEFRKDFTFEELEKYFFKLINKYKKWVNFSTNWEKTRNESIRFLEFPYGEFRKGQRKLSIAVYNNIRNEENLFVQAPTGIGKTIATLFPAVKAIPEFKLDKIFYLTAKTIGRTVAEKAINDLSTNGLDLKSIVLTAKEKMCFCEEVNCDPEYCDYAVDYFSKINDALFDIISDVNHFDREIIESYAKKHLVCPFEFSLDISLFSDVIICDYNYAFDPRVFLKRFFEQNSGNYTFLIDESHNLPDRARSMFSAEINKRQVMDLKKQIKDDLPDLFKILDKMNKMFLIKRKLIKEKYENIDKTPFGKNIVENELTDDLVKEVRKFQSKAESWLSKNIQTSFRTELLEFYFECSNYIKISESFSTNYVSYFEEGKQNNLINKLFCIDPAPQLNEAYKRAKSITFFSATLIPMTYFQQVLTSNNENKYLILQSPFPKENLLLMINPKIRTTYKQRSSFLNEISEIIFNTFSNYKGNYIVFFPSYKYLESVFEIFEEKYSEINTLVQNRNMSEEERIEFLEQFDIQNNPTIAFAVMGGIFGEGIDLIGDKLIGTIIVGVGLPQICLERDLIKDYFNNKLNQGFQFAYQFPGFNKVLQASGRVIRSDNDRGIINLLDARFLEYRYLNNFPLEWSNYKKYLSENELDKFITKFTDKE